MGRRNQRKHKSKDFAIDALLSLRVFFILEVTFLVPPATQYARHNYAHSTWHISKSSLYRTGGLWHSTANDSEQVF